LEDLNENEEDHINTYHDEEYLGVEVYQGNEVVDKDEAEADVEMERDGSNYVENSSDNGNDGPEPRSPVLGGLETKLPFRMYVELMCVRAAEGLLL